MTRLQSALGSNFAYCGFNKGKVYMEPSEALHPSSLATDQTIIQAVRHIFIQKTPEGCSSRRGFLF